ncbi:hypothetical protein MSG28_013723 [Choristoneura fumiferana]|uniref:Uncharacterized protein n=1 Tax=Choristoneura fumiferana TaxID=7141 RepID=A0ACC0K8Q9_CHOFU|nr:hypothetical protein MSG28_013723 [Choristoneura fumiferana]
MLKSRMKEPEVMMQDTAVRGGNLYISVPHLTIALGNTKNYMRFCDTDKPIYDDDKFCNRIVAITAHDNDEKLGTGRIIVPGIFIDARRILTSYTPFRILRHKFNRHKIYITYIKAKAYLAKSMLVGYVYERIKLACARQIVAMEHSFIVDVQWHGKDKTHTPMHDLMIMKTEKPMEFIAKESWHVVSREGVDYDVMLAGPMLTQIADERDEFPETFKIISLGFMDDDHVFNKNHLHTSKDYEYDDKVLEDCEEWFPRDWGYFFCVKNDDDFVSIGSGALLVSSKKDSVHDTGKVFGIGSFMLKKNKASILVFTDIRPYLEAMNMTCNGWDGN